MELSDYVRLLRRRWITILVVLVACLGGAAAVTALQSPVYRSSTQILVALPQGGVSAQDSEQQTANSANYTTNLPQVVQSFSTIGSTAPAVTAAVQASGVDPSTPTAIEVVPTPGQAFLQVSVTAPTPAAAQAVASAFADTFPGVLVDLNQLSTPEALDFRVLSPASLPGSPFRPDPIVNTAIGLALGLILGLAVAIAREAVDRRIRDSRGIEERVGSSVLGVVPHELAGEALPSVSHPDSPRSEAYRKIRTSLLFSGPDGMAPSIVVTSAVSGEGKTSLATNLAVICARAGQRVALVDADLRKPKVHDKLQLSNDAGLSTVLSGEADLSDVEQLDRNGITVITSGPVPHDPSALLEHVRFRALIEQLEQTHDVVLVDTTPTLAVSDAAQVASVCKGAVVVSRLRRTTYDSLTRTCRTLAQVRNPALGIVAVGHDEDPDAGYRYYYSSPAPGSAAAVDGGDGGRKGAGRTPPVGNHRRTAGEVSVDDGTVAGWRRRSRT